MAIDPTVDFDGYVQELVANKLAQQTQQQQQQLPHDEQPISLNIAGQQFQYKNKAEMEQALNQFANTVGNTFNDLQAKATAAATQVPNNEGSYVKGDEPVWKDSEFIDKMTKSPREGLNYWLNAEVFDGKSDNPVADLKRSLTETELTKRSIAAYQFKENHPEFPGGGPAAQVIDNLRQQLNLPYDYNGLEAAYLVAMQRQLLPNFYAQQAQAQAQAQQQQQYQQGQQTQQPQFQQRPQTMSPAQFNGGFGLQQGMNNNPYLQAPPSPGRNNPNQFGPSYDPERLSLQELEQVLQDAGQLPRTAR